MLQLMPQALQLIRSDVARGGDAQAAGLSRQLAAVLQHATLSGTVAVSTLVPLQQLLWLLTASDQKVLPQSLLYRSTPTAPLTVKILHCTVLLPKAAARCPSVRRVRQPCQAAVTVCSGDDFMQSGRNDVQTRARVYHMLAQQPAQLLRAGRGSCRVAAERPSTMHYYRWQESLCTTESPNGAAAAVGGGRKPTGFHTGATRIAASGLGSPTDRASRVCSPLLW